MPTVGSPKAAEPVAPIDCLHKIIREFAVTAVVETVAAPAAKATDPKELAPAALVVPTLVLTILLPAVPNTRFPLAAVIAPVVAVRPVPAVRVVVVANEPGAVIADGNEMATVPAVPVVVI